MVGSTDYPLTADFSLIADIDASASATENCSGAVCKGFTPIGLGDVFTGHFYGHGHKISNLTIQDTTQAVGLFYNIGVQSLVDSLSIVNVQVLGAECVGGLASENNGRIHAVHVSGSVRTNGDHMSEGTGGVVGNNRWGSLDSVSFAGDVSGYASVGGLVGENWGLIYHGMSWGSVSGRNSTVGGVAGSNNSTRAIVRASYSTASVTGTDWSFYRIGGLVGQNVDGVVDSSFALGRVVGKSATGSLIGESSRGKVSNNYGAARVSNYSKVDAVVGTVYLDQAGGNVRVSLSENPLGYVQPAAYEGWDFSAGSTWKIDEGHAFPALRALDNPPMALPDFVTVLPDTAGALDVALAAMLLSNDRDPDDASAKLVMRWTDSTVNGRVYQVGTVRANDTLWGGEAWVRLAETEINTVADLQKIGVDAAYPLHGNYRLMNDLDLAGVAFAPIGTTSFPFTGMFHGNGNVIRNLTIAGGNKDTLGLFKRMEDALVDSLALENVSVKGRRYVGGLVGVGSGSILFCRVQGVVSGSADAGYYAGGFAGQIQGYMDHNIASVQVTARQYVGGFAGAAAGIIENSYSNSYVKGRANVSGLSGITGWQIGISGASLATPQTYYSLSPLWDTAGYAPGATNLDSLRKKASFAGWDFDKVWAIDEGKSFPYLRGMENAPFAFGGSFGALDADARGYAPNAATGAYLVARWTGDSTLNKAQDSIYVVFQVGLVRGVNDTLWGGFAHRARAYQPIQISTYEDLKKIGKTADYPKWGVYELTNDIHAGASFREGGFTPIDTLSGEIHGNGFIIDSLYVLRSSNGNVGLIGVLTGAVDSLHIARASAEPSSAAVVGILAGTNLGSIRYCSTNGAVSHGVVAGGLVGDNMGVIASSNSGAKVSGYNKSGGLVGENGYQARISNSYATGNVTGNNNVGGLAGSHIHHGAIEKSFATGNVTLNNTVGSAAGGLVGNSSGIIVESYATGSVWNSGSATGGLVGDASEMVYGGFSKIVDSYATGRVQGTTFVGALLGKASANVNRCFAIGLVQATAESAGGLAGYNAYESNLKNSFWDRVTTGQDSSINTLKTHGLSTDSMHLQALYSGWDFSSVWGIREGETYPYLRNLVNAPVTVADAFGSSGPVQTTRIVLNDYDALQWDSYDILLDSAGSLSIVNGAIQLSSTAKVGDSLAFWYRAGIPYGSETLWGNAVRSVIVVSEDNLPSEPSSETPVTTLGLQRPSLHLTSQQLVLEIGLTKTSQVELLVYSDNGRLFASTGMVSMSQGIQRLSLPLEHLARGSCIALVRVNGTTVLRKPLTNADFSMK